MVNNDGVQDPAAMGDIYNQPPLNLGGQETAEQIIARLIADQNARQGAAKQANRGHRVIQEATQCLSAHEER